MDSVLIIFCFIVSTFIFLHIPNFDKYTNLWFDFLFGIKMLSKTTFYLKWFFFLLKLLKRCRLCPHHFIKKEKEKEIRRRMARFRFATSRLYPLSPIIQFVITDMFEKR